MVQGPLNRIRMLSRRIYTYTFTEGARLGIYVFFFGGSV